MSFSLTKWTNQVKERLQTWAQAPHDAWRDAGTRTLVGYLATMTLFLLVEALAEGDMAGVFIQRDVIPDLEADWVCVVPASWLAATERRSIAPSTLAKSAAC